MIKMSNWNKVIMGIILVVLLIILAILFIREAGWWHDISSNIPWLHDITCNTNCIITITQKSETKKRLLILFCHIEDYRREKKYLPENNDEFVTQVMSNHIQRDLETGFAKKINNKICYLDRWGRPIKYVYVKNGDNEDYFLYSYGKNGIDEKTKGDDISYSDYVYWSDKEGLFVIDHEAKKAGIPTTEYRKTHPWSKEKEPDKPNEQNK